MKIASFIVTVSLLSASCLLRAEEKVTLTFFHPPDAENSEIFAGAGNSKVGYVRFLGINHPALWVGSKLSILDLNPASAVLAIGGDEQAGYAKINGKVHACTWHGTPDSFVDLHPTILINNINVVTDSSISATTGSTQGGAINMIIIGKPYLYAAIWHGSADSCVVLNPNSASGSEVKAVAGTQQAGNATINGKSHAALWAGSPDSFKDLHPQSYTSSELYGTDGTQQVGEVILDTQSVTYHYAGLWRGTRNSFVNLHPAGPYPHSYATATVDSRQVGSVLMPGLELPHAAIWAGNAQSFRDLHSFLPDEYDWSEATAIWKSGSEFVVGGNAHNNALSRTEAVIWTVTPDSTPTATPPTVTPPVVKVSGKKKVVTTKSSVLIRGIATGSIIVVAAKIGTKSVTAKGTTAWTFKAAHLKLGSTKVTVTATGPGGTSVPTRLTIIRKP